MVLIVPGKQKVQRLQKSDKLIINAMVLNPDLEYPVLCKQLDISEDSFLKCIRKQVVQDRLNEMQQELLTLSKFKRTVQAVGKAGNSPTMQKMLFQMDGSLPTSGININNTVGGKHVHGNVNNGVDFTMADIRMKYERGEPVSIPDINNVKGDTQTKNVPSSLDSQRALENMTQDIPKAEKNVLLVPVGGIDNSLKDKNTPKSIILDADFIVEEQSDKPIDVKSNVKYNDVGVDSPPSHTDTTHHTTITSPLGTITPQNDHEQNSTNNGHLDIERTLF